MLSTHYKPIGLRSIIFGLLFLTFCAVSLHKLQSLPKLQTPEEERFLPRSQYMNALSVGHKESMASLIWVSALTDYGGTLFGEPEFKWFSHYARLATELDSLLYMPYYFVSATAAVKDSTTIKLLDHGLQVYPRDWRLGVYSAMYLSHICNDFDHAARVMERFQYSDTIPVYVRRIYRSLVLRQMPRLEALTLLFQDYLNPAQALFRSGIEKQMREVLGAETLQDSVLVHTTMQDALNGKAEIGASFQRIASLAGP